MATSIHSILAPSQQPGPVTAALRATHTAPEAHSLRQRAAALRDRASSLIHKAPDPHHAQRDALIEAHADALAVRPIFETEPGSPRYLAALQVDKRLRVLLKHVFTLPAPRTPEGLAVVGLALAIEVEGRLSSRPWESEDVIASAARAILAATGAALPAAFLGFGDEPEFAARETAMLAGLGRLPG